MNERGRKDWFTDQYEKVIGKPFPRKEISIDEVLKKLKDSAKYRWIREAKAYTPPQPQTGTVHYLQWGEPEITKCTCPDKECTCRGGVTLPRKKIPRGKRYFKSSLGRKLAKCFEKPASTPAQNFMQRLAAVVGVEASIYKDLERNGILSIRGAEFCSSRCIRYYGAGNFPNPKYFLDKKESWSAEMQSSDTDEEYSICDDYTCTVSTQTTVGPDGEFVIGNFSHVLFASLDETVMKDIEGTELHISSYKCLNSDSHYINGNLSSLDKLLNWRELINLRELKNQISSLKRNIYSSIFEIKERSQHTSESDIPAQDDEECADKKSSEKITIPTPYKGVIIKAKKVPEVTSNPTQDVPQMHSNPSCDAKPKIFNKQGNGQDCCIDLKEKSSEPTEVKEDQSLNVGTIERQSQIESAECKMKYGSCTDQQREEKSPIQNKTASDKLFIDLTSKDLQSSHNGFKTQSRISANSMENKLDYNINNIRDKETPEKQIPPGSSDFKKNSVETKNVLDETILTSDCQKSINVSQKHIKDFDIAAQQLGKVRLIMIHKNIKESVNKMTVASKEIEMITSESKEHTKYNIGNFFKKRLYKLSFEHLQKIKIKQLLKSFSFSNDSTKVVNDKEINLDNIKKTFKPDMNHNIEKVQYDDKTKGTDDRHFDSRRNDGSFNLRSKVKESKPNPTQNLLLLSNVSRNSLCHLQRQNPEVTSFTECKPVSSKHSDNLAFVSMKEKCGIDEKKSMTTENPYKTVISSDDNILASSVHRPYVDTYNKEDNSKNNDESRLAQSEDKTNNELGNSSKCIKNSPLSNNLCSKEKLENSPSMSNKISNISVHLKKMVWKKLNNSIK